MSCNFLSHVVVLETIELYYKNGFRVTLSSLGETEPKPWVRYRRTFLLENKEKITYAQSEKN
jgi:hypothetical protein